MEPTATNFASFDIAIELVQQRDQNALVSKLRDILLLHLPGISVHIYQVFSGNCPQVALYGSKNIIDLASQPILMECNKKQTPVTKVFSKTHSQTVFPITGVGRINLLLDIEGEFLDAYIPALTKIILLFRNQYLLLDKNDHDALTGLLNRRAFNERLNKLVNYRQRRGNETSDCFAIFDIDHFKQVNDEYGHLFGDEVLIIFAGLMEKTFRYEDQLFRYGGEEFCVILKDIDIETAITVLDRFRENVANHAFPQVNQITISTGVTAIQQENSAADVISNADRALYFAKGNGRNQVQGFERLLKTGKLSKIQSSINNVEIF